jgi:hypothetical protein
MSEFYYYSTTQLDNLEIIQYILEETNLYIIPHIHYKNKNDLICTRNIDDNIKSLINSGVLFSLWNKAFCPVFPLSFVAFKNEQYRGMFYFQESPSLTFDPSRFIKNKEGNCLRIVAGCLYHTKELYDEDNHVIIPIPQSVKEAYKSVVTLMKKKLLRVKKKSLWMGKEAFSLFKQGEIEIYYSGKWIKFDDI